MQDVTVTAGARHDLGIDVVLCEERGDWRNCWRDVDLGGLSDLALVAGAHEVGDVAE